MSSLVKCSNLIISSNLFKNSGLKNFCNEFSKSKELIAVPPKPIEFLSNGHMSYIENREEVIKMLKTFVK